MIQDLRYDMRCYFNLRSKANTSELNPWASAHRGKWGQLTPLVRTLVGSSKLCIRWGLDPQRRSSFRGTLPGQFKMSGTSVVCPEKRMSGLGCHLWCWTQKSWGPCYCVFDGGKMHICTTW